VTRRGHVGAAVLAVLAAAAIGAGIAWAAFVGTTSNDGNSFQASSCFYDTQQMSTGSYTGNAVDGRAITTGFKPDLVMVKANTAQVGVLRTSTMNGDVSKPMSGATALAADRVQSLTATGFTLGRNAQVNSNGPIYQWVAMKSGCGLKVGSYTGNGGASRAVSGVGFQPEVAFVTSAGANQAMERFAGMTRSFAFSTGTGATNAITALDSDGFTVGNAGETNTNGTTYHYAAFDDVPDSVLAGSYTGTGIDNSSIGTVGFQPGYLMIRANDTLISRSGHHRPASLSGGASQFWAATANSTNGIQALEPAGFQLGTDGSVNALSTTYHYIAFKNTGGGCSVPESIATAAGDSWVEQAVPTANFGNDSVLKVITKSVNANTRALLQFTLPSLPSGCSLTGATLRVYNKSPVSGRTLGAYRNDAAWTESGVTWSNQPATTGPAATAATPSSAGWMQWDVTSQVEAMYSGSDYGFSVRDESENGPGIEQQFESSEGTNHPQLVLEFG
jgi:hypothetical protein